MRVQLDNPLFDAWAQRPMFTLTGSGAEIREIKTVVARIPQGNRDAWYREWTSIAVRRKNPARPGERFRGFIVDDGMQPGEQSKQYCRLARSNPARIILAMPVARDKSSRLPRLQMKPFASPEPFRAVSIYQRDFDQTADER